MIVKRLVRAALYGAAAATIAIGITAPAHADEPDPQVDQSQANRLSLFHGFGLSAFGGTNAATQIPGTPGRGMWSSWMGNLASNDPNPPDRGWYISGSPFAGYDTNPEARHEDRSSFFAGADLNAGYHVELAPDNADTGGSTQFDFNYDLAGAVYEGNVKQADGFQQTVSASARHGVINDAMMLSLHLQDQYTYMQGHSFLNTIDVVPSAEVFWFPQFSTEVIYDFTLLEYFYPVSKAADMDADRHTLRGDLHFYTLPPNPRDPVPESKDRLTDIMRQILTRATIGFAHVWNGSDGANNEYEANRLILALDGLRFPNTPDLSVDFEYAHEWQNYLKGTTDSLVPPSLGGTQIGFRRNDHIDYLTLRANTRLLDLTRGRGTVAAFMQYNLIFDQSNIFQRDYNEHIISVGMTYRY